MLSKKLRQQVEVQLAKYPHLRDDDRKLIGNIWQEEYLDDIGTDQYQSEKVFRREVISDVVQAKLSSPESIRRTRQKIQELQPLLRGKTYKERQKHQSEVKKEIRAFNN
jgi:hypothetical protein